MLAIDGMRKHFFGIAALDGVDIHIQRGTVTGLIGPNGAGKTTLFGVISGLVPFESGAVVFDGTPIGGAPADRIARRGLVRTFQVPRPFARLTVLENLMLYGPRQPGDVLWKAVASRAAVREHEALLDARARAVADRLNLTEVLFRPAAALSGGQKKLLEIGRALMAEPKIILLDEPAAGVNLTLAHEIADHIRRLRSEGITFIVIEHNMELVARLCDPVLVMAEGRVLAQGSFDVIARDEGVLSVYMGRRVAAAG